MKIFVSYDWASSKQWLETRLLPVLRAAGHEPLVDFLCFEAGEPLKGQMNDFQDQANVQLLVLTNRYLASPNCRHEMKRAFLSLKRNWSARVIPIIREELTNPPRQMIGPDPLLHIDMKDDKSGWAELAKNCDLQLGVDPARWLRVRDEVNDHLRAQRPVYLHLRSKKVAWKPLLDQLAADPELQLSTLRFGSEATTTRRGAVEGMLEAAGLEAAGLEALVADNGEEMIYFQKVLAAMGADYVLRQAWLHFDELLERREQFNSDFFNAICYQVKEAHNLAPLILAKRNISGLLANDPMVSPLDVTKVVL